MADAVRIVLSPPLEFIQRQSAAFRRQLLDLDPLWDRFKTVMSDVEQERFDSEGHGDWPPLAAATLRDRARKGYGSGPILVRESELRDSLVDPARAAQTTRLQMTWGTDVGYAHWHQDGGTIPGRPPQRVILDIRTEDRRRLEMQMVDFVNWAAARTWGRI